MPPGVGTRTAVLEKVDLFAGVDTATLERLLEAGRALAARGGEYVVRQGEYGDTFFVLLRGEASVQVAGEDGRMREVARLTPGSYFGELAMLGAGERKASVQIQRDAELLELRRIHFDQTLRKFKAVKARIEAAYTRSVLDTFIRQSRYFRELPAASLDQLVQASSLESFSKDDTIAREGDSAQKLYIVRSGFVRISRRVVEGRDEILAYLGPEDFFGDEEVSRGASYGASAVAVEPVECMVVPRSTVWNIYLKHPEVFASFRRYSLARSEQQTGILASQTSMGFVRDMLEAGLGQARSALIINMDSCVRCGNCVQACDDLHGYSRLARRGKKLTRRRSPNATEHEELYFPTSCLQCATPECMVGCPTGAIARDVGGEVYIKDTCIGCGNCARNCDFGNISMAKAKEEAPSLVDIVLGKGGGGARVAPERGVTTFTEPEKAKSDLIAVKCDVCFEREFAACVYNCPVEAVLRIDPRSYFEELKQIAPKLAVSQGAAAKTTTRRPRRWIDAVLQSGAFVGSLAGGWLLYEAVKPNSWTGAGLYAGVTAAVMMALLSVMGLRKRLRTQRLGPLHWWARAHAVLGGALWGVVLFHAGYQASGVLTTTLLALVTIAVFVGLGGQLASALLPRLLARSEDEAMLPEDVGERVRTLTRSNEEFLATLDERARARVEGHAHRLAESGLSYVRRGISPKALPKALEARAKKLPALTEGEHAVALRVAENLAQIRMHGARRGLEVVLTGWLPVHLVASAMALMLLLGHLLTVFLW